MVRKIGYSFLIALGFAIGASLFGLAVALIALPQGWQYIPVACASIGWTLGFTLGLAWLDVTDNHSPTEETTPTDPYFVERNWSPDGVGGWFDPNYLEEFDNERHLER